MKKLNLKSKVRPKIFWGGIVVLLLVTSCTFYMLKKEEEKLRVFIQRQLVKAGQENIVVAKKFFKTSEAKKIVEEELAIERENSVLLKKELQEKEAQIQENEAQIKLTLDKLEKEITARRQAEARLIVAMREKRMLEAKLKNLTSPAKVIELEKIVIRAQPALAGKVLAVNKEHDFVILYLERGDDLKIGDVLSVYRNDEFIGRVQVEKVEERICAAAILPEWKGVEFKIEDEVREI